jgi:hypothetical protein
MPADPHLPLLRPFYSSRNVASKKRVLAMIARSV